MRNSISSGGKTHIRYQHFHYPRLIQIVCPYCQNPAKLIHNQAPETEEHFIDIAYSSHEWLLSCSFCLKRILKDWDEIEKLTLLNKLKIRDELIWAWNINHLDYLIGLFSGNQNKDHQWAYFKTYIHKEWFAKTKNASDINKLRKLLDINKAYM